MEKQSNGKRHYRINASDAEMAELGKLIAKWQTTRKAKSKIAANPFGFALTCVGSIADAAIFGLLCIESLTSLYNTGFSDHTLFALMAQAAWSISSSYSTERTVKKWGLSE